MKSPEDRNRALLSRSLFSFWQSSRHTARLLSRYGLAAAAPCAALGGDLLLARAVGPGLPTYVTFYPAAILTAIFLGLGPGLLAVAVSALLADAMVRGTSPSKRGAAPRRQSISNRRFSEATAFQAVVVHSV